MGGVCAHEVDPDACDPGESCNLRLGGCVRSDVCGEEADCEDDDPCTRNERCDPASALCVFDLLDTDEDGHPPKSCGGDDSDDADPEIHPGADDVCDGIDNNGNGEVDEEPAASASCMSGTCSEGICPNRCNEHDSERVWAFVAPRTNEYINYFMPCLDDSEQEIESCVRDYAEEEEIGAGCATCMVPLAQCFVACGSDPFAWTTECNACSCSWTDCTEACITEFETCSGTPFQRECP